MPGTSNSGGRNRQSIQAHKQRGTYRPGRHGKNGTALNVPEGEPDAPETLTGHALDIWNETIQLLKDNGTLTASDGPAVLQYCQLAALADRLQAELDEQESCVYPKSAAGGTAVEPACHPLVGQITRVRTAARAYLTELGLTPASRDRVPQRLHVRDLEQQKEHDYFFGRP